MGVIDKTVATVSCAKCGIQEEHSAVEKGSSWGSGGWTSFDEFKNFIVTIESDQYGPEVTSASCMKCGAPAEIRNDYRA